MLLVFLQGGLYIENGESFVSVTNQMHESRTSFSITHHFTSLTIMAKAMGRVKVYGSVRRQGQA
jgi:hypothetical protein